MCRSTYEVAGGRRCPSCLQGSIDGARTELSQVNATIDRLDAALGANGAGAGQHLEEKMMEAVTQKMLLVESIGRLTAEYNATDTGIRKLEARLADGNLSASVRAKVALDLERAKEVHAQRAEERVRMYTHQDDFRAYMLERGVSQEKINEVLRLATSDTGSPWPRSFNRYQDALNGARAKVKAEKARYEEQVMNIEAQGLNADAEREKKAKALSAHKAKMETLLRRNREAKLNYDGAIASARESFTLEEQRFHAEEKDIKAKGLPRAQERKALAKAKAAHEKNNAGLLNRHHDAMLAYEAELTKMRNEMDRLAGERMDAIIAGNVQLAAACTLERAEVMARDRARTKRVERVLNTRRSDRNKRSILKRRVEAMAEDAGISKKEAWATWKNPPLREPDPASDARRMDLRITNVDKDKLKRAYAKTEGYKPDDEAGFNAWVAKRIMASPAARLDGRSVEEMQEDAELFPVARPGRKPTSRDGLREVRMAPRFSEADLHTIGMRAAACHQSKSSYMRAMVLSDGNPWLIQNDRSRDHHRNKIEHIRQVIGEGAELLAKAA